MRIALVGLPVLLASLLFACTGCTPMSTYPPDGNEAAVPWMYPIPQTMAKSLAETYRKTAVPDKDGQLPALVYNIPAGIPKGVWEQVKIDTDIDSARMATAQDLEDGTPVWSVKRVSVRGMEVKVDVVYPEKKVFQLAVVALKSKAFGTFQVTSFQRYLIMAEKPVANNPFESQEGPAEIAHTDGESASSE